MAMMSRLSMFPRSPTKTGSSASSPPVTPNESNTTSNSGNSLSSSGNVTPTSNKSSGLGAVTGADGLPTPPESNEPTPDVAPALVMPSMAFSSKHNNLSLLNPTPPGTPPPPPANPYAWLWRCHICHIVYPLGCTRRCLECSHEMCSTAGGDSPSSSPPRNGGSRRTSRKRRAGGPCRAEFDYANWAAWGTWKRSQLDRNFASAISDPDRSAERDMKEGMFVGRTHNCALHCDYPSECHHVRFAVLTTRRQVEAALAKEKLVSSAASSAVAAFKKTFIDYNQQDITDAAKTNNNENAIADDDDEDESETESESESDDDENRNPLEQFILSPINVEDAEERANNGDGLLLLASTAAAAAADAAARSAETKLAESKRPATAPVDGGSASFSFSALQIHTGSSSSGIAVAAAPASAPLGSQTQNSRSHSHSSPYVGPAGSTSHRIFAHTRRARRTNMNANVQRRGSSNDAIMDDDEYDAAFDLGNPANLADLTDLLSDPEDSGDDEEGGNALKRYNRSASRESAAQKQRARRSLHKVAQLTGLDSFRPLGSSSGSSSSSRGLGLGLTGLGLSGPTTSTGLGLGRDLDSPAAPRTGDGDRGIGLGISNMGNAIIGTAVSSPSSIYSIHSASSPFPFTTSSDRHHAPSRPDTPGHADRLLSSSNGRAGAQVLPMVYSPAAMQSDIDTDTDSSSPPTPQQPIAPPPTSTDVPTSMELDDPQPTALLMQPLTKVKSTPSPASSSPSVLGWWSEHRRNRHRKSRWARRRGVGVHSSGVATTTTPSPTTPMLSSPSPNPTPDSDDWDAWTMTSSPESMIMSSPDSTNSKSSSSSPDSSSSSPETENETVTPDLADNSTNNNSKKGSIAASAVQKLAGAGLNVPIVAVPMPRTKAPIQDVIPGVGAGGVSIAAVLSAAVGSGKKGADAGDAVAIAGVGDDDRGSPSAEDRDLIDLLRIRNAFMRGDI